MERRTLIICFTPEYPYLIIGLLSFMLYYFIWTSISINNQGPFRGLFWGLNLATYGWTFTSIIAYFTKQKEAFEATQIELLKKIKNQAITCEKVEQRLNKLEQKLNKKQ